MPSRYFKKCSGATPCGPLPASTPIVLVGSGKPNQNYQNPNSKGILSVLNSFFPPLPAKNFHHENLRFYSKQPPPTPKYELAKHQLVEQKIVRFSPCKLTCPMQKGPFQKEMSSSNQFQGYASFQKCRPHHHLIA